MTKSDEPNYLYELVAEILKQKSDEKKVENAN